MMTVDLDLLERWLSGWSLARGLPLPRPDGGGLVVDVGWPEQLRRHVFMDAGRALQDCAARTAVFDRIETLEAHRKKGLGTALMFALDALAERAGVSERLLVATEAGRALYASLGWQVLAPYSSAVLPAP